MQGVVTLLDVHGQLWIHRTLSPDNNLFRIPFALSVICKYPCHALLIQNIDLTFPKVCTINKQCCVRDIGTLINTRLI